MKAAITSALGKPDDVTRCVEVPEPGSPATDEATVAIDASPINPSDLLYLTGGHFTRPTLPLISGGEAVGRVLAAGAGVQHLTSGDRVIVQALGNWVERRNVKAAELVRVPDAGPVQQFATLRVAPLTAFALCYLARDLQRGDWVIQNAANSAVGALFTRFSREKGLRTVNIIRQQDATPAVIKRGGDVAVLDGEGLAERVAAATNGARITYGIDAVGGQATFNLCRCMAPGGRVLLYGMLSGEPCVIHPADLIAKGLTIGGFRLKGFFDAAPAGLLQDAYAQLAGRVAAGEILTEIEAEYPIEQIREALAHAQRRRTGKILLRMGQDGLTRETICLPLGG